MVIVLGFFAYLACDTFISHISLHKEQKKNIESDTVPVKRKVDFGNTLCDKKVAKEVEKELSDSLQEITTEREFEEFYRSKRKRVTRRITKEEELSNLIGKMIKECESDKIIGRSRR